MHETIYASGPESLQRQWESFRQTGDRKIRARLVEHYLEFARMLAAKLYRLRADNSVSFDDYLQYARTGLVEAVDRYQPGEVAFEAFAVYRVRGAILNGLGSESELAAQRKAGFPRGLLARLESLSASPSAVSSDDAFDPWVHKVVGLAIGLMLDKGYAEPSDGSLHANPYAGVEMMYLRRRLLSCLNRLPAREQDILRLHYFEHMEFQSIAESLKVTKGRVSQIHAKALDTLRQLLGESGRLDAAL